MKFRNMNNYIYRGHDIIENKTSYGLYGDNDELIRIFNKKDLEPIPFGNLPLTFIDMLNLVKFTELLKGDKKE